MNKYIFNSSDSIGIIANDAGAANLILGWVKEQKNLTLNFCLSGPAIKIFQDEIFFKKNLDLEETINNSSVIITGTSHSSMLEHNARIYAKKNKVISIAVIDHWVNYEVRFIRDSKKVLPDIIWVFDEFAEKIAKNIFTEIKIECYENFYLKNLVKNIKKIEKVKLKSETNILYVLEPIRKKSIKKTPFEFEVLNFFLSKIKNLKSNNNYKIRLRLHPSEKSEKYEKWLKVNKKSSIAMTIDKSLEEDIAWADIVVGYESFALVVASASSKRCISSKLPNEKNANLKIKNLEYLRDFNK